MKKLNLLLTLLLSTIIFSCGNDDSNDNMETSEIVGTWKLLSRSFFNQTITENLTDCEKQSYIQFKGDNTYYEQTYVTLEDGETNPCLDDGVFEGPYNINGNSISTTFYYTPEEHGVPENETVTLSGAFSIENNILTIDYENEDDALFTYQRQ